MLSSHLTLNRTLATHILLARLQLQPLPPPHLTVRSWLSDCSYSSPLSSLFSHVMRRPWTLVELDDHSSGRLREDSTTTSRGPRRRAWTRVDVGMVCFTFSSRHQL